MSKKSYWALGVIVIAIVFWFVIDTPKFSVSTDVQAQGQALAILGFENKTGDPELDWLETGLPEILLTDLVQVKTVLIISQKRILDCIPPEKRGTHTFEECIDAAKTLGAIHVLSGAFYKMGDKIRIDARIEDVKNGNIIKTQKVIGSDPFELIDSLTAKIAIALDLQNEFQLDNAVSKYTTSPEAYKYYLEGMDLFALGVDDQAFEKFNNAIDLDSSFAMPYLRIAMTQLFSGRQQNGVKYLQLAKDREESLPLREKALLDVYSEIWLQQNYNNGYIKMESFVNQYPDDKEGQTIFGLLVNVFDTDTAKAFEHFNKALEIDPAFQLALMLYSQISQQNDNYEQALKYANLSKKYHPNSPDAYNTIASIQSNLGEIDNAIDTYLEALEKFPQNSDVLDNLYVMNIKKRDFGKSRQYVEMLKRYHSDDYVLMSNYYFHLANLSMWEGNFLQSLKYRDDALAQLHLSKDSSLISSAYRATGNYNIHFERYDDAINNYNNSQKWYNAFQNFSYYTAMVEIDSLYAPKLREEFKGVLENFKTKVPSKLWHIADNILRIYDATALRDTTETLVILREMKKYNLNQNADREIGKFEVLTGDYQNGLDKLLTYNTIEEEPSNAFTNLSLQFYIGYAYEHLGNTQEAIERYEEIVQYWGNADIDFMIIRETKKRLAKLTS